MIKQLTIATIASGLFATASLASVVPGDTVMYEIDSSTAGVVGSGKIDVADGADGTVGPYSFDFDADLGNGNTGFSFTTSSTGASSGLIFGDGSTTTIILSDLDFVDDENLKRFVVSDSASNYLGYRVLSDGSIAFDFADSAFTTANGVILEGTYITGVPIPAAGVLLLGGLGALGLMARRRKAKAKA